MYRPGALRHETAGDERGDTEDEAPTNHCPSIARLLLYYRRLPIAEERVLENPRRRRRPPHRLNTGHAVAGTILENDLAAVRIERDGQFAVGLHGLADRFVVRRIAVEQEKSAAAGAADLAS